MADQPIHLNLDTVEDPAAGIPPYRFALGGREFAFTNPALLDWQIAENLSTLDALAEHCMSDEDRTAFYRTPMASFKLGILFEDVQRHFKLGEFAEKKRRL